MKYATIGWLAQKNHATIIHANNSIESLLDVRDPYTLNSLEEWTSVFNAVFGNTKASRESFEVELDNLIARSGLTNQQVNNLLTVKVEELSE
jgi:hypothetical protein